MALTELTEEIREQIIKQREKEKELLESIAALSDYETAAAAADIYAVEKHAYTFDGYLNQLSKLQKVLAGGVPADVALEAIDTCLDEDSIISAYHLSQAESE